MRLELGEFDEVSLGWPLVNELGEIETVIPELWPDIDHEARARHIVHCVNNHERLKNLLRDAYYSLEHDHRAQRELLAAEINQVLASLEAEKGGE